MSKFHNYSTQLLVHLLPQSDTPSLAFTLSCTQKEELKRNGMNEYVRVPDLTYGISRAANGAIQRQAELAAKSVVIRRRAAIIARDIRRGRSRYTFGSSVEQ